MDLNKRLAELEQQAEVAKGNFHQVTGAIAMIKEQISEESPKEEAKPAEKKEETKAPK